MIPLEKLGHLVSFKTGKLNSNAAVKNGKYPFFTCSQETYRTDTFSFNTTCVLLGGNNANGIYPLKYFSGKFDAYQRTYIIEPLDINRLDTRYLYFAMSRQLDKLRSISTGAATKFLTLTILRDIEIEFPKLKAQRRIASILSAYDDLIENNTRRIAILEEMARRIYGEWFVHFRFPGHEKVKMVDSELGKIPERWEIKRVGQIIQRLPAGKTYKKEQIQNSGNVIVVDQSDSDYLGFHNTTADHCASVTDPIAIFGDHTCKFRLMMRPFSIGPNTIPFIGANNLNTTYSFQLVKGIVKTHEYKRHWTDFTDKKVICCSKELATAYGRKVQEMIHLVLILTQKNTNLRTTRDFLLPKLISGEIDVSKLPELEDTAV